MDNISVEKVAEFMAGLYNKLDWYIAYPPNRDMADYYSNKIENIYELLRYLGCHSEVRQRVEKLREEHENEETEDDEED